MNPLKGFTLIALGLVAATAPIFTQSREVPSGDAAQPPAPQYAAAAERARELVSAAVREQNLPGVSVAVGAGGAIVWAEGFGWRDVGTQAVVTPATRFNIGTAASAVKSSVTPLGLTNTGADPAAVWSPEAIGEPGEDFPPFTFIRHNILQPLGLAAAEYPLPDNRATFYVPTSDDNPARGRRLMYMRDLACCADGMAFYSTPSDLVRFALAKNPGSLDGELAGGMVMSLVTVRDTDTGSGGSGSSGNGGIVVAVTSNIAYANTSSLARRVGDTFAKQPAR